MLNTLYASTMQCASVKIRRTTWNQTTTIA